MSNAPIEMSDEEHRIFYATVHDIQTLLRENPAWFSEVYSEAQERARTIVDGPTSEAFMDWVEALPPYQQGAAVKTLRPAGVITKVVHEWAVERFGEWASRYRKYVFTPPPVEPDADA